MGPIRRMNLGGSASEEKEGQSSMGVLKRMSLGIKDAVGGSAKINPHTTKIYAYTTWNGKSCLCSRDYRDVLTPVSGNVAPADFSCRDGRYIRENIDKYNFVLDKELSPQDSYTKRNGMKEVVAVAACQDWPRAVILEMFDWESKQGGSRFRTGEYFLTKYKGLPIEMHANVAWTCDCALACRRYAVVKMPADPRTLREWVAALKEWNSVSGNDVAKLYTLNCVELSEADETAILKLYR